jgi:hypothetical protein
MSSVEEEKEEHFCQLASNVTSVFNDVWLLFTKRKERKESEVVEVDE